MASHPIALALDRDHRAVMKQAVEDRRGDGGVLEDLPPLSDAAVGGQDDRARLIAAADDLEEVRGGLAGQRQVAELVDDQARPRSASWPASGPRPRPSRSARPGRRRSCSSRGSRPRPPCGPAPPRASSCRRPAGRSAGHWSARRATEDARNRCWAGQTGSDGPQRLRLDPAVGRVRNMRGVELDRSRAGLDPRARGRLGPGHPERRTVVCRKA